MRSEIERVMGEVARVSLRGETPNGFEGNFADRPVKVLPPFLGEMGFEIIHFLARIEPYLRNGWRILARRPALYPPGSAFFDPAYFDRLNPLIAQYGLHPTPVGLRRPEQRLDANFHIRVTRGDMQQIALEMRYEQPDILLQESKFELLMRDLFYSYCDVAQRGVLDMDLSLLSCQPSRRNDVTIAQRPVLCPSYRPTPFLAPGGPQKPHVGVQLRAMAKTGKHPGGGSSRDSDPGVILPLAEMAAAHLGLPIIVYGRPEGNLLPDGYEQSYEAGIDLLDKELRLLSACQLMFAPDSGWADLMAWLQVPTLLEGSAYSGHFDALIGFQPRIALLDRNGPLEPQIDRLLAAEVTLPGDTRGSVDHSTEGDTKAFLVRL